MSQSMEKTRDRCFIFLTSCIPCLPAASKNRVMLLGRASTQQHQAQAAGQMQALRCRGAGIPCREQLLLNPPAGNASRPHLTSSWLFRRGAPRFDSYHRAEQGPMATPVLCIRNLARGNDFVSLPSRRGACSISSTCCPASPAVCTTCASCVGRGCGTAASSLQWSALVTTPQPRAAPMGGWWRILLPRQEVKAGEE